MRADEKIELLSGVLERMDYGLVQVLATVIYD